MKLKSSIVLFFLIICAPQIFAARLSGKIKDAQNGELLIGATVMIPGYNLGAVADGNGVFVLTGIPSGTHTLKFAYMGYQTTTFTRTFKADDLLEEDFTLQPSDMKLGEVQVVGRAEGQVKAFADQRDAENIMNVVSAEMIESFPDLNSADALQRVTGVTLQRDQGEGRYVQLRGTPPEFTNFNVNGIQLPSPESDIRTVGMDIINASQIQTIEVVKVLTPDLNADAIGGSVNLKTKRAESGTPEMKILMAGGFNNLRQSPNGELQFSFGQRVNKLGFLVNANYNYTKQGADNIEFKYEKGVFFGDTSGRDNYHLQYNEVQLRHYELVRKRTGLSTTLDYKFNKNNLIYITGMYNRFSDNEIRRRKVYTLDDATSERSYLYGGIEHDLRDRVEEQILSVINLGSEHRFGKSELDYEFSWAKAVQKQDNGMEVAFDNSGQAIRIRFDNTNPTYPKPTFPEPLNAANATDYDNFDLDKLLFTDELSEDLNLTGRLNFKAPYKIGKSKGYIKVGGLVRTKDKYRDVRASSYGAYNPTSRIYPIPGDTLSLQRVAGDFSEDNLLGEGYVMEAMPDPEKMRDFFEKYQSLFIFGDEGITETRERTYGEDYTATEDLYAGYFMIRHDFKKLMILTGLRYEQTDIGYQGYRINKSSSGFITGMDTIQDQRTQAFLLPNLQFKYTPARGVNYRAALTYSYARPNFRDVIPYRVQSERSEVRFGNPDINYPLAMNVDVLAEKYWGGRNMISGGIFYKNIKDFVFNYRIFGFEGDPRQANFSRVQVEIPLNGKQAEVRGAEVQTNMFFNFLPGKLKNTGIYANYTYTNSKAIINKRLPANDFSNIILFGEDYNDLFVKTEDEILPMPGQAQHTVNLALFYDSKKVYFKVALNYTDAFLNALGADADLDEYYGENFRIDINGYYQFNKTLQVFADLRNATNAPLKYYLGDPDNGKLLQQEFYSYWARLGLRINL